MAKRRQDSFAHLWAEMVATLFKRPTVEWIDGGGPEYLRFDLGELAHGLSTSGDSDNLPAMAGSIYLHRHGEGVHEWHLWFDESLTKWMGSEVDSTIYDSGHVCAVVLVLDWCVSSGNAELEALAIEWLRYYGARAVVRYSARARRVLAIGQRSAGHNYSPMFADDFLQVGRGWDPPKGWKDDGRDKAFLWALRDLVRMAFVGLPDKPAALAYLRTCGRQTKTLLHVYETARGLAVWHDPALIDGATRPVPVAIEVDGLVTYFPPNRADGHNQSRAKGGCTVTRTAGSLIYDDAIYGHHEAPLPPGAAIIDEAIGGLASPPIVVPTSTSGPDPAPLPPQKENKWTGWL